MGDCSSCKDQLDRIEAIVALSGVKLDAILQVVDDMTSMAEDLMANPMLAGFLKKF